MDELQLIVVNYRTPGDLGEFLASVPAAAQHLDYHMYVANVQPTDEDLAVVKDAKLSKYDHHVVFSENVGYARAVNHCASREITPYLGIFNADVVLSPNFFDQALTVLGQHPEWGVLGPRQVNEQGRLTAAGIFGTNEVPVHRDWMQPDTGACSDIREDVVTLAGSALIVNRECWDEMRNCEIFQEVFPGVQGGFLPTPHYWDETGFLYHLRHHGWTAVYYGPLCVVHKWHRASVVGGWAEEQMSVSQQMFRGFCQRHGISHD